MYPIMKEPLTSARQHFLRFINGETEVVSDLLGYLSDTPFVTACG
jgi:hypothetical protein